MQQEVFAMGKIFQGDKIAFIAHVSVALKDFVVDSLRLGFFVSQVMVKHRRIVQELVETSGNLTRDAFLCEQDIQNIAKKIAKETYKNMKRCQKC